MKKFLIKVILFIPLSFLALTTIFLVSNLLWNTSELLKFSDKNNVLILGDSHTKYAINDNILDNTINFSNDADSYFYSYLKLKAIKKKNPQIDTVLLSFSYHNLDKSTEDKWLLDPAHIKSRFKYYAPLMSFSDLFGLFTHNKIEVLKNLPSVFISPVYILSVGENKFGGHEGLGRSVLSQEIEQYIKASDDKEQTFQYSDIEKNYLAAIIDYCMKNNIQLILFNSPMHSLINKENNHVQYYTNNLSKIPFIDLCAYPLPDSCFADLAHLNKDGAVRFSNYLRKTGISNLLTK